MKYLQSSPMLFTVGDTDAYRRGWEETFGKKECAHVSPACDHAGIGQPECHTCDPRLCNCGRSYNKHR